MSGQDPNSLRRDEQPDYPFLGPFGGIQSEVPIDKISRSGFQEVQNLLFRKAQMRLVPSFTPLVSPSGEPIMGMGDFFNQAGTRIPVVWTPTKMYKYTAGAWTQITGALTGNTTQYFQWDVIGYKIYFSQQKDVVQVWDGITAGFAAASGSAVPAKYLCELGFHLLAANTIEAGPANAANRIHWTGVGDGTDWTSFSSGQADLFNGLGPINGLASIYQAGYAFQQWGITQIIPTGNGLAPFQFIKMGSKAKGSILPYGVASFGEVVACYVGKDNIYLFDGTESQPIGSKPIDGGRVLGARSRIFNDLFLSLQTNIFGFILTSANGNDYESYWLLIPQLNKAWVYHFDEGSWTQIFFNTGQLLGPVGVLPLQNIPRIMDLIGTIQHQSWTPAQLVNGNQLDTMAVSDVNANSVSWLNFGQPGSVPTSGSLQAGDGWYIKSGALTFDDSRHKHSCNRIRLCLIDYAPVTINFRLTNEVGQSTDILQLSYGTGSGATITQILAFESPILGIFLTWEMSGPPGVNWGLSEITPYYDVSGEIQAGTR